MAKKYKLKDTLARLFGARKAKRLIKGLKEDYPIILESTFQSIGFSFMWEDTRQGHNFWSKVDKCATRKIKGYESTL